jgi:integrating conjugative element protein (TIGR03759 family)
MTKVQKRYSVKLLMTGLVLLAGFAFHQAAFAEQISQISLRDNQVQGQDYHMTITQTAKMWGLTADQYKQYLKEMATTPSAHWWKKLDPPQVLGMNATTENERMEFATIDVRVDQERASKEIAFQHAYNKAFEKLYPNAKLIAINTNKREQASNVHSGDRYYLFTAINDPEGAMLATKLVSFMQNKSNVALNIFFVGKASYFDIQRWAKGNNLPVKMENRDEITLNHNKKDGGNMMKQILKTTKVSLPVLVRLRDGHSDVVSLTTI